MHPVLLTYWPSGKINSEVFMKIFSFILTLVLSSNILANCSPLLLSENASQVPTEIMADINRKVSEICYDSLQVLLLSENRAQFKMIGGHPYNGITYNPPAIHSGMNAYKLYFVMNKNTANDKTWMITMQLDFTVDNTNVGNITNGPRFDLWYSDITHKSINIGSYF
jgi:hypothetical protein